MKQDQIDQRIRQAQVCYMSNTKWRKLFTASESYTPLLGGVKWKLIAMDEPFENTLSVLSALEGDRFGDCLPAPYVELREIERIFIPRFYRDPHEDKKRKLPVLENDLDRFQVHLRNYGQFPIFEWEHGIEIRGYAWEQS